MNIYETEEELQNYTNETPFFDYSDQIHLTKIVKCVDGDTVYCIFKQNNKYYQFKIRMAGYDSPEMRPRKADYTELEREEIKKAAYAAKDRISELLQNKYVYIYCEGLDKYGRILGTIKLHPDDEITINQIMINEGHGYPYNGGTKRI